MRLILILISFLLVANCAMLEKSTNSNVNRTHNVASVLDSLHVAASQADSKTYFNLFTEDAIFIGTDVGEYWSLKEFKSYAMPGFNKGKGWTYIPRNRDIKFSNTGKMAWFHEVLDNKSYGTTRGTGVLVHNENNGWLISQYHLTIPIPNDIAVVLTDKIKAYEAEAAKVSDQSK